MTALAALPDPGTGNATRHELLEVLTIALVGSIYGAESCVDFADFARDREALFRDFLKLENGLPSHDTFSRLLAPVAFAGCFAHFLDGLGEVGRGVFGKGVVHDQQHRSAVAEQILDLRRAPANVDRHDHRPRPCDSEIKFKVAVLFEHQQRDPVGAANPHRTQSTGDAGNTVARLRPGPLPVAEDRGDPAAVDLQRARRNPCVTFISLPPAPFCEYPSGKSEPFNAGMKRSCDAGTSWQVALQLWRLARPSPRRRPGR